MPDFNPERRARTRFGLPESARVCGVDEAGRGPWAGPVAAAAVIFLPDMPVPAGLDDSKRLGAAARARLEPAIQSAALAWSVAFASVEEIDAMNILNATCLAMARAVAGLAPAADLALVDGNRVPPGLSCPASSLVGGDGLSLSVAAASILAKTARDRLMEAAERDWPGYGFARHKGYGAPAHAQALARLGPCPLHRMSFRPVAAAAAAREQHSGD